MSDNGFISRWQRELRDFRGTTDAMWKVGMALSTFADQYTDDSKGYQAGEHARPGVIELSRAARVARRNVRPAMEKLLDYSFIEYIGKGSNGYNEYRLLGPGCVSWTQCVQETQGSCAHETHENVSDVHTGNVTGDTGPCITGDTHCSTQGFNSSVSSSCEPGAETAPEDASPYGAAPHGQARREDQGQNQGQDQNLAASPPEPQGDKLPRRRVVRRRPAPDAEPSAPEGAAPPAQESPVDFKMRGVGYQLETDGPWFWLPYDDFWDDDGPYCQPYAAKYPVVYLEQAIDMKMQLPDEFKHLEGTI